MAKFSKGQYVLLATALRRVFVESELEWEAKAGMQGGSSGIIEGLNASVEAISEALKRDNPSFSMSHFKDMVEGRKELNSSPFEDLPGWWPKGKRGDNARS